MVYTSGREVPNCLRARLQQDQGEMLQVSSLSLFCALLTVLAGDKMIYREMFDHLAIETDCKKLRFLH